MINISTSSSKITHTLNNMTSYNSNRPKLARFEELYFYTEDTKDDMVHFKFFPDLIPIGDSNSMCFHLRYRSKLKPMVGFDQFESVTGFEQCKGYNKMLWGQKDPTTGLSLLLWKEFITDMGNYTLTGTEDGILKNGNLIINFDSRIIFWFPSLTINFDNTFL